jgi:hypothetical protein
MHPRLSSTIVFQTSLLLGLILIGFEPYKAAGQQQKSRSQAASIHIGQQTLYPEKSAQQWLDSLQNDPQKERPIQVVLRLNTLTTEEKIKLEKQGIHLRDYLSGNTCIATLAKPGILSDAVKAGLIQYIIPVQPEWKMGQISMDAIQDKKSPKWLVSCEPDIKEADFLQQLKAVGGHLLYSPLAGQRFYEISLSVDKIKTLAAWYGVRSIGLSGTDQPLNFESTAATKVSIAHLDPVYGGYGLMGDSITVGIGETGPGMNNIDLRDRIINYNPLPYSAHGIHVTGTVGATGTMDQRGEGFAPHTNLINHNGRLIWASTGTMKQQHNMSITNNSYAIIGGQCGNAGVYDANSQALDQQSQTYPEILHVFAAGNDGIKLCNPFPVGYATVTGNYQPAKNVLVVANCDKQFQWGPGSSRGPVKDGRLKPEITAIGTNIISTRSDDLYLTTGGTSMAAPQVTGAGALLQQEYKRRNNDAYPPSDLLKALLMNGATDIGNPGPDYTFGFGVLNMNRSLDMLKNGHFTRNAIGNNDLQTQNIAIPANTAQLKVMLYWHDLPASLLSATQLVNDLDLEVVDAANNVVQPLILDASPAGVTANALPGADHINNVEQVVINAPFNGPYTIRVKGTRIPAGTQDYAVVYDFIPATISLTYPTGGAKVSSGIATRIYWDASPGTDPFSLEFSSNNGSSWLMIDNAIPAAQRNYQWSPPAGTSTDQCRIRLTRNGETFTTGSYVINMPPSPIFDAVQCPGYINFHWEKIANATAYQVLRKKGPYLQIETTITDTFYSFRGLSMDSLYYVGVRPVINGVPGYRSQSIRRKPDNGSCTNSISNGDLMIEKLESPVTGRIFTSSQLGNNVPLQVRVRNLDDITANNYQISWSMNGAAWQSYPVTTPIPAGSSQIITVPAALNMSLTGNYDLRVAVRNLALTDPASINDSIRKTIAHLENAPVNIYTGFTEDFETTTAIALVQDSMGITPNHHWDFQNSNDSGVLKTLVNSDITISGNRSLSLSSIQFTAAPVTNMLTGTFNTSAYNVAQDELRLEFDYKIHGQSHFRDSNKVWVRAADSLAWVPVYSYDMDAVPGTVLQSGSISVTDAILAAGKNYSPSMQIRFGQQDTTVIALNNYGTGITLDNIRLYAVVNDVALDSLISPENIACNLNNMPVTVRVYNSTSLTQNNISVSYNVDNGPVYTEIISSLAGKTRTIHTFAQLLNGLAPGPHTIKTWVALNGDTYTGNDSLTETVHNQPLISSYPYLENFEANDGYWFAEGINSSWAYGTPASSRITQAASGTKAWKTNLTGTHNDSEYSFLYSPCYDLSGLNQPMLSFSTVLDIEHCGNPICDGAWMEYSLNNGQSWTKLGAAGQGQSWYTNANDNVWDEAGNYRWRVASIPLPVTSQPLRLRFVLLSDVAYTTEGISLDDVHIYNRDYPLYNDVSAGPISQAVSGSNYINFLNGGKLFTQIRPDGQNLGNTDVNVYMHPAPIVADAKYYLARSFKVTSALQPADSVTARFYITDAEVTSLVNDNSCAICAKPKDAYRIGIAKYDDLAAGNINGTLTDNIGGTWTYYAANNIKWVPYDIGYYAEVRLRSFSEIWFNDGTSQTPLSLKLLSFGLTKNSTSAFLHWELQETEGSERVTLQRSGSDMLFTPLVTFPNISKQLSLKQSYDDDAPLNGNNYYRLAITEKNGRITYSNILSATFGETEVLKVYPNPATNKVQLDWKDNSIPATIRIHNAVGQLVYSREGIRDHQAEVSLNTLPSGIYTLTFQQEDKTEHRQLQIIH